MKTILLVFLVNTHCLFKYSKQHLEYNEKHTREILRQESKVLSHKLQIVKQENAQMERTVTRNKMYGNKDEEKKQKKEIQDKNK